MYVNKIVGVVMLAICVTASDKKTKDASDLTTANSYGLGYGAGYGGLYSAYPHYYAPATSYSIKYHGRFLETYFQALLLFNFTQLNN